VKRKATRGFFPVVIGEHVEVRQAGGLGFAAKRDLSVTQGGGRWLGAGNDISIRQGGAMFLAAGNGVDIEEGGAGVVAAGTVRVEKSYIGFALAGTLHIDQESTVIFGSGPSVLAGVLLGAVIAGLLRLRGKVRRD
jgi:hypothetical protein